MASRLQDKEVGWAWGEDAGVGCFEGQVRWLGETSGPDYLCDLVDEALVDPPSARQDNDWAGPAT